jgi:SMC interacting uncharacterized protein involved in chromosome segregation
MNLKLSKKQLDLQKLETSKLELEYKILERMADVERIQETINKQNEHIEILKKEIRELKETNGL